MTRPKVPDEKRQRTAQACDSCKRRKQKCNGFKPCSTCIKRRLVCIYTGPNGAAQFISDVSPDSPNKRRHIEATPSDRKLTVAEHMAAFMDIDRATQTRGVHPNGETTPPREDQKAAPHLPSLRFQEMERSNHGSVSVTLLSPYNTQRKLFDNDAETQSRHSTISGPDEEADVYAMHRHLKDSTGRLLWLGDSATLSYLQLIRNAVFQAAGKSAFTDDPSQTLLLEVKGSVLGPTHYPHFRMPSEVQGRLLVEAFFTNTMGLVDVLNKKSFETVLHACYTDPLHIDTCTLCLLYLVFAIGLVFANPAPDTEEAKMIDCLRNDENTNWAETFYRSAKLLQDPVSGFEDADLWSVQALVLMSLYTLAISKRNAAYAYHGMAVRSALALGLHRQEALEPFSKSQRELRRNLWKTLFIFDRFLSASLGRPTAINEEDCSQELLYQADTSPRPDGDEVTENLVHAEGLKAVVRSSQSVGIILKKVYSKRKISTALAQEITLRSRHLHGKLHPELHWKRADHPYTPGRGIAILHVNLFQIHTTILLTRPFFLFMISKTSGVGDSTTPNNKTKLSKYAQACVQSSYNTIFLVNRAYKDGYLSQRNPFVLYFLFAASLTVLCNQFFGLFSVQTYKGSIENAITLMKYCAQTDPQAKRLEYILQEFRAVVTEKNKAHSPGSSAGASLISSTPSSTFDPMASLPGAYADVTGRTQNVYDMLSLNNHTTRPATYQSRNNSIAAMAVHKLTEPSSSLMGNHNNNNNIPKVDTSMTMSSITPPHSTNSVEYYHPMTTPDGGGVGDGGLGDAAVIDFNDFWHWDIVGQGMTAGMTVPQIPAAAGFATNSMGDAPRGTPGVGGGGFSAFGLGGGASGAGGNIRLGGHGHGSIPMYPPSNFV